MLVSDAKSRVLALPDTKACPVLLFATPYLLTIDAFPVRGDGLERTESTSHFVPMKTQIYTHIIINWMNDTSEKER